MKDSPLMTLFLFVYHLLWTVLFLFFLPVIPFLKGQRFRERLGLQFPSPLPRKERIWIHALSVGEVLSATPLVRALKEEYPEKDILMSVSTRQGLIIAKKEMHDMVATFVTMPVDFWWATRRLVSLIHPSLFVLIETDLWPGLLFLLYKKGVRTLLINGRVSPGTYNAYRRWRGMIRAVFDCFERCFMQSDLDRSRLISIGIPQNKLKVAGNIKFDREWTPMTDAEYRHWIDTLNIQDHDVIWVAGSTHEGEEKIILDVFKHLRPSATRLRLIIAPRNIERAAEIRTLAMAEGLETVLRSDDRRVGPAGGRPGQNGYDVLILNTLGELSRVYGIGNIGFVGGSLVPFGGHNLLEPAGFGLPVIFGPHMHNFVSMAEMLLESGGGIRVENRDELLQTMKAFLTDPEKRGRVGREARAFALANTGALARIMTDLRPGLNHNRGPAKAPTKKGVNEA